MGKIPNGIQPHVLFNMDGRIWIENVHAAGNVERLIERGYAIVIPQDKLDALVQETLEEVKS